MLNIVLQIAYNHFSKEKAELKQKRYWKCLLFAGIGSAGSESIRGGRA
jgi:hypothetical protein